MATERRSAADTRRSAGKRGIGKVSGSNAGSTRPKQRLRKLRPSGLGDGNLDRGRIRDAVRGYHIVRENDQWKVVVPKGCKTVRFSTEGEAIAHAKNARGRARSAIFVHHPQGGVSRVKGR